MGGLYVYVYLMDPIFLNICTQKEQPTFQRFFWGINCPYIYKMYSALKYKKMEKYDILLKPQVFEFWFWKIINGPNIWLHVLYLNVACQPQQTIFTIPNKCHKNVWKFHYVTFRLHSLSRYSWNPLSIIDFMIHILFIEHHEKKPYSPT